VITAKVQLHELEKVGLVCVYTELVGETKMKNVAYKDLAFGRLISIQDFIWRQIERQLLVHACCACSLKADSHIACRAHATPTPFPCHAVPLIHTCHAVPLPCSDSAVSFVKVRVVDGNIRTASPTVQQIVFFVVCYYHSLQS
jgi:hypothetical protein